MRFVSTRSLRNHPGGVKDLVQHEDLVLTANGEPIGILVGVRGEFEQAFRIVRQARAQAALSRLRRAAARRRTRKTA